ncbi:MAG: hypothetical protein D6705_01435 [Deltaproteobacteria bacterium]|nr:MAG: hypothetical protein D6705_01435 [Deltaproteobacteria bacterium]
MLVPFAGCGDDGGGDATDGGTTASSTAGTDTSATDAGTAGTATTAATGTTTGGGEVGGLLTVTYYLPDAVETEPALGMAGGLRMGGITGIRDFYAVVAFQLTFPTAPSDPDTIEDNEIPVPFSWGQPTDWVAAGNGIKLESGDTSALACLLYVDDDFPVYVAESSDLLDPACAPDPAAFLPETAYDLVVYGGDAFEDARIEGLVSTPPTIEVTGPDLSTYDLPVDTSTDLEITWTPGDGADRIVIRVWDQFGRMLTAHAADDGSFTLPADRLGGLTEGPGYLTVARERETTVPLPVGSLDVVTRTEVWGYVDLFAGG